MIIYLPLKNQLSILLNEGKALCRVCLRSFCLVSCICFLLSHCNYDIILSIKKINVFLRAKISWFNFISDGKSSVSLYCFVLSVFTQCFMPVGNVLHFPLCSFSTSFPTLPLPSVDNSFTFFFHFFPSFHRLSSDTNLNTVTSF